MVGETRLALVGVQAAASRPALGTQKMPRAARPRESVPSTQRIRIVDGALGCIARQGVAKTTLDDVAHEAGCSRATVYRVFPGGKDSVLRAVVETEVSRLFSSLAVHMGEAVRIDEVLVGGMVEAATQVSEHEALSFLLEHEPEVVLPHLAFSEMDSLLRVSSAFVAPFLGRWLDHDEARRVAEWAARIVISYLACPAEGVDMTDRECVRRLVRTFILPGIRTSRGEASSSRSSTQSPDHESTKSPPTTGKEEKQ